MPKRSGGELITLQQHLAPVPLMTDKALSEPADALGACKLPDVKFNWRGPQDPDSALRQAESYEFSVSTIAAALQKANTGSVLRYLSRANTEQVADRLTNHVVDGNFPVLFFAIARNDEVIVADILERSIVSKGAFVRSRTYHIPALAFAVLYENIGVHNGMDVFKTLLAAGATPDTIPKDMWIKYMTRPSAARSTDHESEKPDHWCTDAFRAALAHLLNLSHRYFLMRASMMPQPAGHRRHALQLHDTSKLNAIPYRIVGQGPTIKLVTRTVFAHLVNKKEDPLTMMFAGPSGHGKTELAEQMGRLINFESTVIDCTRVQRSTELYGSNRGYHGSDEGSQLNNFLALNNGRRCVVFLDEIEKMGYEARQALRRVIDSGTYSDNRTNEPVNTKRTIFIMGTNSGSGTIQQWFSRRLAEKTDAEAIDADLDGLKDNLRREFESTFGSPLTGRCNVIVPFFPFIAGEQAVMVHTMCLKYQSQVRKPVNLSKLDLVGHVHLEIQRDEEVCKSIAASGYVPSLGARSIQQAVSEKVEAKVTDIWGDKKNEIKEDVDHGPLRKFTMRAVDIGERLKSVQVFASGMTDVPR